MTRSPSGLSLPPLFSALIAPLPRLPGELALTTLVNRLVRRRPELLRRLGPVVGTPIAIVPDDLPHAFLLTLRSARSEVRICDKSAIDGAAATVRAPLLVLLGLLDGTYDGDAMFFTRDLRIEGKTEHVLALRNTLEDAELTPGEFLGLTGKAAGWVNDYGGRLLERARDYAANSGRAGRGATPRTP